MNPSMVKLTATLKAHKPSRVRAFVGDDERDIAVPKVRNWASRVTSVIEGIGAWSRVELMDKGGALLAAVDNTDPATDLQDLSGAGGMPAQVERVLAIVLKAQREAMAFRDSEMQGLLRAHAETIRELTAGTKALTGLYQMQVEAARELAEMHQERAESVPGGSDMQQLLEALPTILQALPALRTMLGGNGVKAS